ncbi:MAG: DUF2784 domain-containing protein [Gemmatimonadaceae bacterium]
MYRLLADAVVLVHAAFVAFVILGGFLALRWRRIVWAHVPAAIWGVLIEYAGWICPLTPLEHSLRAGAGEAAYSGDFIDHYVLRALYPSGLTPRIQVVLGSFALVVNLVAYTLLIRQVRASRPDSRAGMSGAR